MPAENRDYRPDYGVPPGRLLDEFLGGLGISAREFSRRCGRSAKLIVEIIAGKAPVEPETAMQFERVLGMGADVWLAMEAHYRLRLAEVEDEKKLAEQAKKDEARQAAIREANLKRMMSQAGSSDDPSAAATGTASSTPKKPNAAPPANSAKIAHTACNSTRSPKKRG